ncbi:unnamed protein product [Didymodactylos carnosus]|uniref:Uncharacterized protein n=1 Tax=Didymodactylos carnosus TaxID=1234261 RepID=A0A813NPL8_9BILA|nr:unnamed protein product [Didymodactylos carnosus]CAF0894264.1 unnamed protein product [Didymodactylos carnosus]CAF3516842.1 unnamed protein product [Didymodactylos carnosus]CAF3676000.1 unnamed protein product [Didymodactylos carnosus]
MDNFFSSQRANVNEFSHHQWNNVSNNTNNFILSSNSEEHEEQSPVWLQQHLNQPQQFSAYDLLDNSKKPTTIKDDSFGLVKLDNNITNNTDALTRAMYSEDADMIDEETDVMLKELRTFTTAQLVNKIRDMMNMAYQLGVEEAKEMSRGKLLNIFDQQTSHTNILN